MKAILFVMKLPGLKAKNMKKYVLLRKTKFDRIGAWSRVLPIRGPRTLIVREILFFHRLVSLIDPVMPFLPHLYLVKLKTSTI